MSAFKQPVPFIIAVDGPAASGKGTLALRLAEYFGLPHLDTGGLYRAVGKKTLSAAKAKKLNDTHRAHAIAAADNLSEADLKDHDLSSEWIGQAASIVSAIPEVRKALFDYQRAFAAQPKGAVLDGRDIGTVICPDATVKLYVTAAPEIRAKRRWMQQKQYDSEADYDQILKAIHERDARDMGRKDAPLKAADDAFTIDSTPMNADTVFVTSLAYIQGKIAGSS